MQIKRKVKNFIKLSSLGMLGALTVAMICPSTSQSAQAADVPAVSGDDNLSVSVSSVLLALEADPSMNNGTALGSVTISAKTTNVAGYTMKLNANNTALRSADSGNTATIPTLASDAVLTNFPANRWGYYFGTSAGTASTAYKPLLTTATEIDNTTSSNSTLRNRTLTIAARVDNTLPASTYSTQLTVSVVGNPPAIEGIQYMQEMTRDVCSHTPTGYEKQLIDKRDGQTYWVGRDTYTDCWMLQNLALGTSSGTTALTTTDSNITSNWTLPAALTTSQGSSDSTAIQSWNFGKWVLATPLLSASCGTNGIATLSNCTQVGFVDVSDTAKFKPTHTATNGNWAGANATDNTLVAVNCTAWSGSGTSKVCTAGTYDAHYLVGNYYSWNAVTAGTNGGTIGPDVKVSICPNGWTLPRATTSAVPTGGTFTWPLSLYGLGSTVSGRTNSAGVTYNIAGEPFHYVRGGEVMNSGNNFLGYSGEKGYYWSYTVTNGNVKGLFFDGSSVDSLGNTTLSKPFGLSVRCVNAY